MACILISSIKDINRQDLPVLYEKIENFFGMEAPFLEAPPPPGFTNLSPKMMMIPTGTKPVGFTQFKWDPNLIGHGIELSEGNMKVYLREQAYMFRTVISDRVTFDSSFTHLHPDLGFYGRGSLLGDCRRPKD